MKGTLSIRPLAKCRLSSIGNRNKSIPDDQSLPLKIRNIIDYSQANSGIWQEIVYEIWRIRDEEFHRKLANVYEKITLKIRKIVRLANNEHRGQKPHDKLTNWMIGRWQISTKWNINIFINTILRNFRQFFITDQWHFPLIEMPT